MHASSGRMVAVCLSTLLCAGCAAHGALHASPDESKPHISWELRSGADEGDEEFLCGSAQLGKPCALAASPGKRRTLAVVLRFDQGWIKRAALLMVRGAILALMAA